ncbi:hypothetical protein [Lacrimispora celerecrescens]|uniref:hypothetical protein n=1 Tax=Lacrimispora celerecrescens TaxID=29354 RepID=UPI002E8E397B|nr:hypothetical protein [Lacrimispora celerecrescens]
MMKISWFDRLYVGEKAKKKRYRIIQGIRRLKPGPGIYVITPAANGNNILDIYPAMTLLWPLYREEEFLILGIASGYWEALEVAGNIIGDMYRKTGGFDLSAFIGKPLSGIPLCPKSMGESNERSR